MTLRWAASCWLIKDHWTTELQSSTVTIEAARSRSAVSVTAACVSVVVQRVHSTATTTLTCCWLPGCDDSSPRITMCSSWQRNLSRCFTLKSAQDVCFTLTQVPTQQIKHFQDNPRTCHSVLDKYFIHWVHFGRRTKSNEYRRFTVNTK